MGSGRGRRAVVINLEDEERETLERWVRRRSTAQALAVRSRIVLAAAEGRNNVDIAEESGLRRGDGLQVAEPFRGASSGRVV